VFISSLEEKKASTVMPIVEALESPVKEFAGKVLEYS
jgi:hypothetical protein